MIMSVPTVAELLGDGDPEARRRGTQRLGELAGAEALRSLIRTLGDDDWRVRKEAAAVAGVVEPRSAVVRELAAALGDREHVGLRNAAVEAMILIGADAVPWAVEALGRLDADGRKLAVEVLGGVPSLGGTQSLVLALGDPDVNVRAAAAEALRSARLAGARARQLAVAALIDCLSVDEPLRRLAAMSSLVALEAELPWTVVEPLARDPLLRRQAIAAAGRSHDSRAIAALARATAEEPLGVARDALIALANCLCSATPSTADLAEIARHELLGAAGAPDRIRSLVRDSEPDDVRGAALVAIGLLRVPADVPELVRGLGDPRVAERAEVAIRRFGRDAVAPLLKEGARSSATVRATTLALAAALSGAADAATLDALREALGAGATEVRVAALQALSIAGTVDDMAVVAPHATSEEPRVAAAACAALTSLASCHLAAARLIAETIPADGRSAIVGCLLRGAGASRHEGSARSPSELAADVAFLRAALDNGDERVRRAAVDGLAAIGGSTAAEVVARALADEQEEVVLAAVRALGRMRQADTLAALVEGGHDKAVVAVALRALGEASSSRAFELAGGLVGASDPRIAAAAVETIGQLQGSLRDDALFRALGHGDPGVVKTALVELSRDLSASVRVHVARCLDSDFFEVRRLAAELLSGTDDVATHALIRSRLDRETDPAVREALTLALVVAPKGPA